MVHISAVFCTFCIVFLQVITFYLLDDQSVLTAPVVYRKERSTCLCCAEGKTNTFQVRLFWFVT